MGTPRPHISIVTPAYKCADCILELHQRLVATLEKLTCDFEIIFVNDASPEQDWEIIKTLVQKDIRVKGINLSRNFGQHFAITAGLDHAKGDWVVVMDCDLQDQPEEIAKLYSRAQEGYDVVFGKRSQRKDKFLKKLGSRTFNKIFNYLSGYKTDSTIGNFSICTQRVIENFRKFKEHNRAYAQFIHWMGFKQATVGIEHAKRPAGKSAYTFTILFDFAIQNIVAYSNKPLKLSIGFGLILAVLALIYGVWLIIRYFLFGVGVEGWTSVMVSISFLIGLLFANMGILGLYIGKVFDETKNRPIYIIQETIGQLIMAPIKDNTSTTTSSTGTKPESD